MEDISSFIKLHNTQLRHLGVPRELWDVLEKVSPHPWKGHGVVA